jgi:hypothetical protein
MNSERFSQRNRLALLLAAAVALAGSGRTLAQPTLVSSAPINGATGVSPTAAVVFTFSEAMDADTVTVNFFSVLLQPPFFTNYNTLQSWNAGTNILTCTPSPAFLSGAAVVYWSVDGADLATGTYMDSTNGLFTTSAGGGGIGTNAITTFSVGKVHHYQQTSASSPTLDPTTPYGFSGVTSLSSNRTVTGVTLTLPTVAVSNLVHLPPPQAEIYLLSTFDTSLNTYEAAFPAGNYSFFVQAASSNQTVVVNLPTTNSLPQPGAPHVTNYLAAQAVDPSQAFVLGWDAFPGGTATDYIDVDIGSIYGSPNPGLPGALTGTARTFTIPAGTLLPNTTYASQIGFFRFVGATNASYASAAFRATYTEFSLITTGAGALILTNAAFNAGTFSFDVLCTNSQNVTVEYRTNLAIGQWQTLFTTNNPPNPFHAIAPQAATNRFLFFRARTGT